MSRATDGFSATTTMLTPGSLAHGDAGRGPPKGSGQAWHDACTHQEIQDEGPAGMGRRVPRRWVLRLFATVLAFLGVSVSALLGMFSAQSGGSGPSRRIDS